MQLASIVSILGGKSVLRADVRTRMDLVNLGRKGVSKRALMKLAGYLDLSLAEIAELLPITERTIQRYSPTKRFRPDVSEHILQIAEVAARGAEVFGEKRRFLAWMQHPSAALGGITPGSLLSSRFGTALVLDELGRIEHGVVS